MQISKNLERLAQSHGCVRKHADHKSTDAAAFEGSLSQGQIIACGGGCTEGSYTDCGGDRDRSLPKVWTKKNPTFYWDYCSCQSNSQMDHIIDHTRVGCSAIVGTDGKTCIFCYLNTKKVVEGPTMPRAGCPSKISYGPPRPVVPGCAGCAMARPDFGRSVNPI